MKTLPNIAWILGYGGLIPFVLLTFFISTGLSVPFLAEVLAENLNVNLAETNQLYLVKWQAMYAAIILSFLGAVSWGVALAMQDQLNTSDLNTLFIYGVTPSILAWFALLLPQPLMLWVLAMLVVCVYLADVLLLLPKLNSSYAALRLRLTLIVAVLLSVSAFMSNA